MNSTTAPVAEAAARGRMARWGHAFLDGRHPWGSLEIGPVDRTGLAMRYQLTVYPPGITTTERRALVLGRRWPATGTILAILLSALLGTVVNGWVAVSAGLVLLATGFLAAAIGAGEAPSRVLRLRATVISGMGAPEVLGDLRTLERAAGMLLTLDRLRASGEVGPVDHELLWGRIYQELAEPLP